MFSYIWPIGLVVLSNVLYNIFTKSVSSEINPFASLTITYLVGAIFSAILFFVLNPGENLIREYTKTNAAPFLLGLAIVGLEVGYIYAYRNGWQVSTAAVVQGAFLSVALIFVGVLIYKEALTWNKLTGIAFCLAGLVFINLK